MRGETPLGPHPAHPVRCEAAIWLNCALHQDEAASSLQKTLSPLLSVAFFALLDYDELHNLRVRSEIFDQTGCFHNFPFQVVTSVRRICFLRSDMNVLLPPKAEIPLGTHHDCARYSKEVLGCKNPSTVLEFAASSSLYD